MTPMSKHLHGARLRAGMLLMGLVVAIVLPSTAFAGVSPPPVFPPGPEPSPGTICQFLGICWEPPIQVSIDIKPGTVPNCFNNDGHGVIPVAILGSPSFDVTLIAFASVSLQHMPLNLAGNGVPVVDFGDVNRDGFVDVVVQFVDVDGTFGVGVSWAALTGSLVSGRPFGGFDTVCIVQ